MEAKKEEIEGQRQKSGKITEEEAREMADELRHYRVKKGFPAE